MFGHVNKLDVAKSQSAWPINIRSLKHFNSFHNHQEIKSGIYLSNLPEHRIKHRLQYSFNVTKFCVEIQSNFQLHCPTYTWSFPLTISSIHYELPGKNDSVLPQDLILEKVELIKNSREALSTILKTLSFKSTDHFNYWITILLLIPVVNMFVGFLALLLVISMQGSSQSIWYLVTFCFKFYMHTLYRLCDFTKKLKRVHRYS